MLGPTRGLTVSQSTQFPPPPRQSRPSCRGAKRASRAWCRGPSEDLTARTPPCSGADRPADRPVWTPHTTSPASGQSWQRPGSWGGSTALLRSQRVWLHPCDDEEMNRNATISSFLTSAQYLVFTVVVCYNVVFPYLSCQKLNISSPQSYLLSCSSLLIY